MTDREVFIARAQATPAAKAPYTMVDIGRKALPSPIENLDLSQPVEGALSGCLRVIWKNETPLLVGGGNAMDEDPGNLTPLEIDNRYALPGATIKGLIRATMEIASFARLSFVENFTGHTHSYDDKTWQDEVKWVFNRDAHSGGWLFRTPEGYRLVKAAWTERIALGDIVSLLPNIADVAGWHAADMQERQQAMDAAGKQGRLPVAAFGKSGHDEAQLVVAGQTAGIDRTGQNAKNAEHLFFWPDGDDSIPIDKGTGDRFLASLNRDPNTLGGFPLYDALITTGGITGFEGDERPDLATQLADPARYGLPVFWRYPGNGAAHYVLSLTALYRVPYRQTVHDLIPKTQGTLPDDQLDLVQALLGWAPREKPSGRIAERKKAQKPLRSRVRFGFAFSDNATPLAQTRTWAPGKPRPSYWPYYLKKDEGKNATHPVDYSNPTAILAGRKRYPARNGTQPLPDGGTNAQTGEHRNEMEQALTFLEPGALFTGDIRFRNISPVELGALVWAITFGVWQRDAGFRHMIGRAKSHGYGQVAARISEHRIKTHRGDAATLDTALEAFTSWVSASMGQAFDTLPTIRQLKSAAHAATGAGLRDHLVFPKNTVRPEDSEGQKVLNAYGALKKRAQEKNGIGGTEVTQQNEIGLPPYPGGAED